MSIIYSRGDMSELQEAPTTVTLALLFEDIRLGKSGRLECRCVGLALGLQAEEDTWKRIGRWNVWSCYLQKTSESELEEQDSSDTENDSQVPSTSEDDPEAHVKSRIAIPDTWSSGKESMFLLSLQNDHSPSQQHLYVHIIAISTTQYQSQDNI
jgi:hypothetical protein